MNFDPYDALGIAEQTEAWAREAARDRQSRRSLTRPPLSLVGFRHYVSRLGF
jgi:hypothetical protein